MNVLLIILFTWVFSFQPPPQPEAGFRLENISPLVGEPVTLILRAVFPADTVVTEWPDLEQEWEMFSFDALSEMSSSELDDGSVHYEQMFTMRVWYPGEYSTPEITIAYQTIGNEHIQRLAVNPAFLNIPSVLEGIEQPSLFPLKPQIWLPYTTPLVIAAIAAGAVALVFVGYHYTQRQRSTFQPEIISETPGQQSPGQIALLELKRIYQQNAPPDLVIAQTSICLRTYVERKLNIPALDLTSDELLEYDTLQNALAESQHHTLERVLRQADLVKFAQYIPTDRQAQNYLNTVGTWIQDVDAASLTAGEAP